MENLENKFKDAYDNIDFSKEARDRIEFNIVSKYNKKQKMKKVILSIVLVFSLTLVTLGATHAEDIKNHVYTFISKMEHKRADGEKSYSFKLETEAEKVLNYDAPLNKPKCRDKIHYIYGPRGSRKCYEVYTRDEIKEILGINILNSTEAKLDYFYLNALLKNEENKITFINFRVPNIFQIFPSKFNKDEKTRKGLIVEMSALINTKYRTNSKYVDKNVLWDFGIPEDSKVHKYYMKNLGVNAYIAEYYEDFMYKEPSRIILFVYDDIGYRISVTTIGDSDKIDENIHKFLDTLSY